MPVTIDGSLGVTTPMYNGSITANAVTPSVNMKNRIINGAMVIDQRNAGASLNLSATGQYTVDRWQAWEDTDGTMTAQQSSVAPTGFTNSLVFTTGTADASLSATQFCATQQRIEGFNVADLGFGTANAKTITLSFWVRSSLTGTFGGGFRNGASNRSYAFTYTISAANTWEQKSVTIAGDTSGTWLTTNGIGLTLTFGLGVGSDYSGSAGSWQSSDFFSATGAVSVVGTNGATWYITGVQLEVGSTATSFDYRPYGTELALCQRYYYVSSSSNSSGAQYVGAPISLALSIAVGQGRFPVSMRAAPTVSLPSGAGQSGLVADSVCTASEIGTDAFIRVTISSGTWSNSYTPVQGRFTASAEL